MRQLQPAIKEVKRRRLGIGKKESMLLMELYKERGLTLLGQSGAYSANADFIGLYIGLRKVVDNPTP